MKLLIQKVEVGGISAGSGFLLSTGSSQFLISAKHVLIDSSGSFHADTAIAYSRPRDPKEDGSIVRELDLKKLEKNGNVRRDSPHDVIAIKLGSLEPAGEAFRLNLTDGVKVGGNAKSGQVQILKSSTKVLKDVSVGNDAIIFGYPVSIGIKDSPQFDQSKPLLRRGVIAGTFADKGTLIVDCFVYPGNSGGPVMEIEHEPNGFRYSVIGLVSEFIPVTEVWKNENYGYENTVVSNSGYSVVIGMDPVWAITDD